MATPGTGDFVRSVAFSPDGALLALGQYGGSTLLLSTSSWKPVGRSLLEGHRARVLAGLRPPRLARDRGAACRTSSQLGRAAEGTERHACLVAGRELSAREWRDALPDRAQPPVC